MQLLFILPILRRFFFILFLLSPSRCCFSSSSFCCCSSIRVCRSFSWSFSSAIFFNLRASPSNQKIERDHVNDPVNDPPSSLTDDYKLADPTIWLFNILHKHLCTLAYPLDYLKHSDLSPFLIKKKVSTSCFTVDQPTHVPIMLRTTFLHCSTDTVAFMFLAWYLMITVIWFLSRLCSCSRL